MGIKWSKVKFGDILLEGTRNGIYKKKIFHGSGVKIVNMGELFSHPRLFNVPMKRVKLTDKELSKLSLKPGDLLFARRSLLAEGAGKCSIVMEIDEPTVFESSIIRARPDPRKADSLFLYYFFISPYGRYLLSTILRQVAVSGITGSDLIQLEIILPTLDQQRIIAHILGTLDDKIELNHRMNRTLEAMAQAIFKSWFVDFEPVRAKAEGRDPGLPKEIADLFPDSFQDSEIGEIPKGWEAAELGDVVEILDSRRVPLSARERAKRQGPYLYYGAAGVLDHVDEYLFEGVHVLMGEDGSVIDENDHPFVQYVWGQFWVNNHAHVLRGTSGISNEHLFLFLKQVNIRPYVTGAVQPKLNQRNLKSIPFVKPPQNICTVFSNLTDVLFARLRSNTDECVTLSRLRDTLLPKLISGELRVPNVDRLLDEGIPTDRDSRVLYTIGHSNHTIETFIAHLKRHGVTAVADVRSTPYSRFSPQFNKETLDETLKRHGIAYIFLGKELGARQGNQSCYDNGCADFKRIAEQPEFKHGLDRILKGMDKYRIALMCAEKEPLECHRTVLVCRNIRRSGVHIKHILYDGSVEDHHDTERRLLKALKMQPSLFDQGMTASDLLERAYDLQARNIAYQPEAKARHHE